MLTCEFRGRHWRPLMRRRHGPQTASHRSRAAAGLPARAGHGGGTGGTGDRRSALVASTSVTCGSFRALRISVQPVFTVEPLLGAAFRASAIKNIERVRLLQRSNAPVYLPVGTVGCQSDLRHRPVERPTMPGAPVYRLVCGDVWYHIDGASGAALEKLDSSRRAYRWVLQRAAHARHSGADGSAGSAHGADHCVVRIGASLQPERRRDWMASIAREFDAAPLSGSPYQGVFLPPIVHGQFAMSSIWVISRCCVFIIRAAIGTYVIAVTSDGRNPR